MISIDLDKYYKEKARKAAEPYVKPEVIIFENGTKIPVQEDAVEENSRAKQDIPFPSDDELARDVQPESDGGNALAEPSNTEIMNDLVNAEAEIRRQRGKLSSSLYDHKFKGTSPEEMQETYRKITNEYQAQLREIYEKREHLEKHGRLPDPDDDKGNEVDESELYKLKYQVKRLNDKIYKTKKKLQPSAKPSKAEKIIEWELELDQAELQRDQLNEKITALEHGRTTEK
jgi:hypothetical protein